MQSPDATGVAALQALARGRLACFTTAQARSCGITARRLQGMLDRGEIERVHRSVYRFRSLPWTFEARLAAAVLAGGPSACVSHGAAAHLLGMRGAPRGRPEITVAGSALPQIPGVQVHRSRTLESCDVVQVAGLRCTTGSRTLIDLAGRLTRTRLIALVDDAICAGVASRPRLHARARELRPGRTGVHTLVGVTAPDAEGTFWSALERGFAAGIRAAGLPRPAYNAPVRWRGRTLFADVLWAQAKLIVELHGLRFHASPSARASDAERANVFTLTGYRVLVFTWQDVFDHLAGVVATVGDALGVSSSHPWRATNSTQ